MSQRAHGSSVLAFGLLVIATSSLGWGASNSVLTPGNTPAAQSAAAGPRRSFCVSCKQPGGVLGTDGFARFELGHPMADWVPVDLYGDGTWKLAVLTAEKPARVGVFDPVKATWIDGPRPAPIGGGAWGVGDWNHDGYAEYVYIKADSIRYIDSRTGTDSLLWTLSYRPMGMNVLGRSPQGGPTVALLCDLGTYPPGGPYQSYQWRVHELFTGTLIKTFDGSSPLRVLHGYPAVTLGSRIVLHESHASLDFTPMTGRNYYYQSIWILSEEWQVLWHADLPGAQNNEAPPIPLVA